MNTENLVRMLLDETLNLSGRAKHFNRQTRLEGIPELDSIGVVAFLTAAEERLGITVDDEEIDGSVFQTFGSLLDFVEHKRSA